MKNGDKLEVVRGSGNVFRALGYKNADAEQFKAILAAEIIKALDREGLSVRAAHGRTGIAAADFSRIRNADLGRFTVDRLMGGTVPGTCEEIRFEKRGVGMMIGEYVTFVTW
jgi:hypothetical protein